MTTRRQALISVSDKTGIADLAKTFVRFGIELLSTGGTARLLKDAGLAVTEIGEYTGVRVARKHIGWYTRTLDGGEQFRRRMNKIESAKQQVSAIQLFFDNLTSDQPISMNTLKCAA